MSLDYDSFLYRGTTRGWPGNPTLRQEGITCTTTDPLVATLFAIECRNHGPAVFLAARRNALRHLVREKPNHFDQAECAENLRLPPIEYFPYCEVNLEVDQAIDILRSMGFVLPVRLSGWQSLRRVIQARRSEFRRLNLHQIHMFDGLMLGVKS